MTDDAFSLDSKLISLLRKGLISILTIIIVNNQATTCRLFILDVNKHLFAADI